MTFSSYFFSKNDFAKTRYKTHNNKLLAIVEFFKIWKYYLKDCKYKVFMLPQQLLLIYEDKKLKF